MEISERKLITIIFLKISSISLSDFLPFQKNGSIYHSFQGKPVLVYSHYYYCFNEVLKNDGSISITVLACRDSDIPKEVKFEFQHDVYPYCKCKLPHISSLIVLYLQS